jgi:hypothetical protein
MKFSIYFDQKIFFLKKRIVSVSVGKYVASGEEQK